MWPSSSPSKHAVLGLNSTRPSHRHRRLRLQLQLERLEDRQLMSGSTSSSPVLFHDTFSSNTPSSAWSFVGGTWSINNGVLSQTGTAAADPKKAVITNQTFPSNLIVTSEVQVNSWNAGDMARAGMASTQLRATETDTTSSFTVPTRFSSWTTTSPGATPTLSIGRWAPGTGSSSRRTTGPWRARCGRRGPPSRRTGCSSRRDGATSLEDRRAQRRFGEWRCE